MMSPLERQAASEVLWGHGVEWPRLPHGRRPEPPREAWVGLPGHPPSRRPETEAATLLYNMGID